MNTDNGALFPQDVRSDQPPARGTPSTTSSRPLTYDRPACGAACIVIGQSHNRRGADCTLASWDGKRGRQHGSRLDKVVSNSGSALLAAYARWGGGVFTWPAPAAAADQRLKAPALLAMNNRKLVTAEFTAATRRSWNNLSIICWRNRSSLLKSNID